MAKLVGGPLGSFKGKAGGVIGTSWKGIAVIKAMPLSVANPNSVAQQAQRTKFSAVVAVARLLLSELIAIYWDPFAKKMSGYNAFVKSNIDCFVGGILATPPLFVAARGVLVGVANFVVVANATDKQIAFSWTKNSDLGDALATDVFRVVYYNETQNVWYVLSPGVARSNGAITIDDLDLKLGDVIHAWGFFTRPDISKISDSSYDTDVASS